MASLFRQDGSHYFQGMIPVEQLLTIKVASEILRCKRAKVYQLIEQKGLPTINLSTSTRRQYRIPRDAFEAWIKCNAKQDETKPNTIRKRVEKPAKEYV